MKQRFPSIRLFSATLVFREALKGDGFLITPLMKQADVPHASQSIKIRTQNNRNMNIISSNKAEKDEHLTQPTDRPAGRDRRSVRLREVTRRQKVKVPDSLASSTRLADSCQWAREGGKWMTIREKEGND